MRRRQPSAASATASCRWRRAAPRRPSAVIAGMEAMGFNVTHLYGMTESYGPSTFCAFQEEWRDLPLPQRAAKMARQGVPIVTCSDADVVDRVTGEVLPADGVSIGELVMRSNTIMRGYLKDEAASDAHAARRLAAQRRSGRQASGRLYRDEGPRQGHHHFRRREHRLAGDRGGAIRPSADHGSRRRGPPGREMGRKPLRLRRR